MKKNILTSLLFLMSFWTTNSLAIDAITILEKTDKIRFPSGGTQADVTITSKDNNVTDTRKYKILSKGNNNTLVMTTYPADERGQILLMKERDLWVFMPNVSQPIRLGLSQRLSGQVSNGDIARANFMGDYTPTLINETNETYILELIAVDRKVTYPKVILHVAKENFYPISAEFLSLSGRIMKTCTYENFKKFNGNIHPTTLKMVDAIKKDSYSELTYDNIHGKTLDDKIFTKDYLKKLQ